MLDLSRLSPAQRQAVLAGDGPLLIVAGPGSGKTTVLAARIAYLVTSRGVPPTSVLAITFATKATRELRTRLGGLLGAVARGVDVTTFHAFGLRVVRQWSEALGWGPGPLAVWYEAVRRRRGAVDYPAMRAQPLRLFAERPAALRVLQDSYRHVLCDEFQDVCAAQYRLLQLLAARHRNLVVVGDPLQTLYGWRGADVRFLRQFERDFPETQVVSLDQNFRTTG